MSVHYLNLRNDDTYYLIDISDYTGMRLDEVRYFPLAQIKAPENSVIFFKLKNAKIHDKQNPKL